MTATLRRWGPRPLQADPPVRQLGIPNVWISALPAPLVHVRAQGHPEVKIPARVNVEAIRHPRTLGVPAVAWRVTASVEGIARTRMLGDLAARRVERLEVAGLSRAG